MLKKEKKTDSFKKNEEYKEFVPKDEGLEVKMYQMKDDMKVLVTAIRHIGSIILFGNQNDSEKLEFIGNTIKSAENNVKRLQNELKF